MKQIIAIGGGGFGRQGKNWKFEQYLLSLCQSPSPKICFLPQASCELAEYIVKFYETFLELGAQPSWVSLFGRVEDTWKEKLLEQDIIYVGGGNTRTMLAIWKEWGEDDVLREAYEKGIILAGVSAGAICWFEQGITDSVWPLGKVDALGFLEGSCCPHFDSESERQDVYRNYLRDDQIKPGYALEDSTAVHFVDGQLHTAVEIEPDKTVRYLDKDDEREIEIEMLKG